MAGSNATLGDVTVDRLFVKNQITTPAAQFGNSAIEPAAGIAASKLDHQRSRGFAITSATTVATTRQVLFIAREAGTLRDFAATLVDACAGAATVVVDLLKNGTTVLTATADLDSGDADYDVVAATIDAAAEDFVAGDVFEVDVVATAGGGTLGKGLAVEARFDEAYVA